MTVAGQIAGCIQKITTVAVLWVGAYRVIEGDLSIGQLIAFNMLSAQVTGPLLRLVNLWQEFQQVGISVQRLGDVLNTQPEPSYNPNRTTLPQVNGQVVFEDVTFRYRPIARRCSARFRSPSRPGKVIGMVGRSGSGKSTIAKLIQRLYVPERGRILVDGVDLAQVDPAWLRRQVGVVLQENFLFNCSVRDNIALTDPGLAMEQVIQAAKLAGAHEFILELPDGYDTMVGEHGCSLSGGQRQRIAIARALVANPRILIFDEATSALDYESEAIIQQNMAQICQGRTVFIIAHRLSTVRPAHRIYVVEKGEIVEEGSHEELLRVNGFYAVCDHRASMQDSVSGQRSVAGDETTNTWHLVRSRRHWTSGRPPGGPSAARDSAQLPAGARRNFCPRCWKFSRPRPLPSAVPSLDHHGRVYERHPVGDIGVDRHCGHSPREDYSQRLFQGDSALRNRCHHCYPCQDGQVVKRGEVLIELDPTQNRADHDRASNEYRAAKVDAARLRALDCRQADIRCPCRWGSPVHCCFNTSSFAINLRNTRPSRCRTTLDRSTQERRSIRPKKIFAGSKRPCPWKQSGRMPTRNCLSTMPPRSWISSRPSNNESTKPKNWPGSARSCMQDQSALSEAEKNYRVA